MAKDTKEEEKQEAPAAEEQDQQQEQSAGAEGDQSQAQAEDGLPKTQEELEKLIARRLKKEQKKWEKSQAQTETKPEDDSGSAPAPDNSAELAQLRAELQEARAQSAAARLGFKPEVIEDAVYLAVRAANKNNDDDPDDEDIKAELSAVLKKHPEWKAGEKQSSGFRVGAPPPEQSAKTQKTGAVKRWNRFNH